MSESNSTPTPPPAKPAKPAKPTPDFPLYAHTTGRWAKKVRGQLRYFGPWSDPDGALAKWKRESEALLAGREPSTDRGELTVRDMANRFLNAKRALQESGEITPVTFAEYHNTGSRIVAHFGAGRMVEDVGPDDFEKLRRKLSKTLGPVALGNEIQRVRSYFKYAVENGLVGRPMVYGSHFKKPSRKSVRVARAKKTEAWLEPAEILALSRAASPTLRAMVLLGVNCGMGSKDVSELCMRHLDLSAGVVDFPRPKTGIDRRAMLWPETVAALREAMGERPDPADKEFAGRVFLTVRGQPWNRARVTESTAGIKQKMKLSRTDAVRGEFEKLLKAVKMEREGKLVSVRREGVGFYTLRHVFESIAGERGDQAAVDRVMGHADESMAGAYRVWRKDEREDGRLRAIADHVHEWLYGKSPAGTAV